MTANKTERIPVMFDRELLELVDDYGFENRVRTRSETIRQLVNKGLTAAKIETRNTDATA